MEDLRPKLFTLILLFLKNFSSQTYVISFDDFSVIQQNIEQLRQNYRLWLSRDLVGQHPNNVHTNRLSQQPKKGGCVMGRSHWVMFRSASVIFLLFLTQTLVLHACSSFPAPFCPCAKRSSHSV